MPVRDILLLGHPLLWTPSAPVTDVRAAETRGTLIDLADTLADFRARKGFGRGIAAPQIGVLRRIVFLNVDQPLPLLNPRIVQASPETFELWDDCFSFPDLMVRVRRHESVLVRYRDAEGAERELSARGPMSELVQHEIDHLDGILATNRALDLRAFALRSEVLAGRVREGSASTQGSIPLYVVDAFTDQVFAGNPAGVCPLDRWLDDATLQAIAAENGFSETAFFRAEGEAYRLRWFTPTCEMDLCGHATLASAHVLFSELLDPAARSVSFLSRSGHLQVRKVGDRLELDFPSRPAAHCAAPEALARGLGLRPREVLAARDYLAVFESEEEVRALRPDFGVLAALDRHAVIVTAPGKGCDFVSRFFAPHSGVPEDPVTGSSHCTLIPYWSARLGKKVLHARQVSARGGELFCEDRGERVRIAGRAVTYLRGRIEVGGK